MRPPLPVWVPQIFCHALAGAAFANVAASHLLPPHAGSEASFGLLLVCSLTSILTVLLTVLSDGSSHELKMQSRSDFVSRTLSGRDTIVSLSVRTSGMMQKANLVPYLVLLPMTINIVLFFHHNDGTMTNDLKEGAVGVLSRTGTGFVAATISFFAALFISTYLVLIDTLIRRAIAMPGLDIDRLLHFLPRNTAADRKGVPFLAEDLILQSVIWGCSGSGGSHCSSIVRDIAAPRLGRVTGPATFDLEEEEVRRNDAAIEAVAEALLPSRLPLINRAGSLEEDVMRVALLEALGGGGQGIGGSSGMEADGDVLDEVQQFLGLPTRYSLALRKRLLASEGTLATKSHSIEQPLVVPLVRALCAYAGGLGEALIRTCGLHQTTGQVGRQEVARTSSVPTRLPQYVLPPGATTCAELAIFAAARLLAMNTKLAATGGGGGIRRRHSWLSLMIPAVLHSAHRLRSGVLRHAQSKMDRVGSAKSEDDVGNYIAVNCPDLRRLLSACDEAAILILRALMEENGSRNTEIKVHSVCKTWLNGLH